MLFIPVLLTLCGLGLHLFANNQLSGYIYSLNLDQTHWPGIYNLPHLSNEKAASGLAKNLSNSKN